MTRSTVALPTDGGDGLRKRFYRALLESNRLFAESLHGDIDETMKRFTRILVDRLEVGLAFIGVLPDGEEQFYVKAVAGEAAGYALKLRISIDPNIPEGRGPAATAVRGTEVLFFDMETDPRCLPWRERAREFGIGGCAIAPFAIPGLRGGIALYRKREHHFPSGVSDLMEQLAQDVATFLGRRASERDLARTRSIYRALLDEGSLILDLSDEATLLAQSCSRLVKSDLFVAASIAKLADGRLIEVAQATRDASVAHNHLAALREELGGRACASGEAQYFYDERPAEERDPWHERSDGGVGSAVAIPIARGGVCWGVLLFACPERHVVKGEFATLLVHVAQHVGHALDELDLKKRLIDEAEKEAWLAGHDALTGLPNRRALDPRLDRAIDRRARSEALLAVGIFDLDDFKALNDKFGHEVGDFILQSVAKRLSDALESSDFVARLGGDEFVFIFEDVFDQIELAERLERIRRAVSAPITIGDNVEVIVSGSLGMVIVERDLPDGERRPSTFLRQADRALHQLKSVKNSRESYWSLYIEGIAPARSGHASHVSHLLAQGALRVVYQPIVALPSGRLVGIEALARLADPDAGLLAPASFLRHFGMEEQFALTRGVLAQAIADLVALDAGGLDVWVSINVAPEIATSERFRSMLAAHVATLPFSAHRLTFELLEQSDFLPVESMRATRERLVALKELGVRLALDDVGSAYSSLLRLKDLPIDTFKLDREFVNSLGQSPEALHFVSVLLELARDLRVDFVAEGVESPQIADALAALRVPLVQGYAIARPLALQDLLAWAASHRPQAWEQPTTVLGLYARNLRLSKIRRMMLHEAANTGAVELTNDPDSCDIGRAIRAMGLEGSAIDRGHRSTHESFDRASVSVRTHGHVDWEPVNRAESQYVESIMRALESEPVNMELPTTQSRAGVREHSRRRV